MLKGVIFDFNGVLIDSLGLQYESWRIMLEEFGISFSPLDYREKANGITRRKALRNILGENYSEERMYEMFKRKDEVLQEMIRSLPPDDHRLQLLPGVEEFLKILNKHSIKCAVASASKNVALMLQASGGDVYFDAIISANDYTESKPSPEVYQVASLQMGLLPEECLLVEDSQNGILAAKKLHMKTVGITRSHDVEPGMADLTLTSLKEYRLILGMFFPELA